MLVAQAVHPVFPFVTLRLGARPAPAATFAAWPQVRRNAAARDRRGGVPGEIAGQRHEQGGAMAAVAARLTVSKKTHWPHTGGGAWSVTPAAPNQSEISGLGGDSPIVSALPHRPPAQCDQAKGNGAHDARLDGGIARGAAPDSAAMSGSGIGQPRLSAPAGSRSAPALDAVPDMHGHRLGRIALGLAAAALQHQQPRRGPAPRPPPDGSRYRADGTRHPRRRGIGRVQQPRHRIHRRLASRTAAANPAAQRNAGLSAATGT